MDKEKDCMCIHTYQNSFERVKESDIDRQTDGRTDDIPFWRQ